MARTFDEAPFKNLREPTQDDYAKIARDLRLSCEQHWNLEQTVRRALLDCKSYREQRLKRLDADQLRGKAQTISDLLRKLEKEIDGGRHIVASMSLPENLEAIGRLLSFEAVAAVVGHSAIDGPVRPVLERLEKLTHVPQEDSQSCANQSGAVSVLELEWELAERKQVADLTARPELLLHIVRTMQQQFSGWLEQDRLDNGGAPAGMVRRIMLHALACDAHRILTKPIRRSGGRAFVELCEAVFSRCNIATNGSENAIKVYLKNPAVWAQVQHFNSPED